MTAEPRWLQPGDSAPSFALPAVNRDGAIALDEYRGRSAVLLGLYRGFHCPFCRRRLVQLGTTHEKLRPLGVETVAVVNTPVERARLYFNYRPTRMMLAADPDAATHRAFGVPAVEMVADETRAQWPWRTTMWRFQAARINPTGELPSPLSGFEANAALNEADGFKLTEADQQIVAAHGTQLAGHFLIDRSGVIRWVHIEAESSPTDIGRFPSDEEIVAAVRTLPA